MIYIEVFLGDAEQLQYMSNALVISVVVPLVNVLLAGNLSPEVVQAKSIVAGVGVGVGGGQDVGVVHVGIAVGGGDG